MSIGPSIERITYDSPADALSDEFEFWSVLYSAHETNDRAALSAMYLDSLDEASVIDWTDQG